ncbi:lipocalin family protein [Alteromonas flava]|uniref:lipocalin family protein n=1 Tax=Alteromonas flava TaxID=2048003 RepID=UPI000C28DEF7|nr:lipocalin family protein [Alteromonas flava]
MNSTQNTYHAGLASVLFALALALLSGCTAIPSGVKPVNDFDVERYLGQWYEIARFDHSFERGLSKVTAQYTRREDGGIDVTNRGFDGASKTWEEAKGRAYFVDSPTVGHLKVSFFGPFYASYVIMALDKDGYQYSLVTGPNRDYLWILARAPSLSAEMTNQLITYAEQQGYDTSRLIWVQQ